MQFVVSIGAPDLTQDATTLAPLPDSPATGSVERFGRSVSIRRWGEYGDIDCNVCARGESFLLCIGYLAGSMRGASQADREQASRVLLDKFDAAASMQDVCAIARGLNGSFGLLYSGPSGVYHLTDRLASRPIWHHFRNGVHHFSANALTLARVLERREIDTGSFASFLLYGDPGDPRHSVIEGIRRPEAGVVARYGPDGSVDTARWFEFRHRPDRAMSVSGWAGEISHALTESAKRIAPLTTNATLFLSGGVDSRIIGAALLAGGCEFRSITLGDSRNFETRVAAAVARSLGCPNELIIRDVHWYLRALSRSAFLSGGTYDFTHAHFRQALGRFDAAPAASTVLLGDFAEVFSKLLHTVGTEETKPASPAEFFERYDQIRISHYRPPNAERTLQLFQAGARDEAVARMCALIEKRYAECLDVSDDPRIVYDVFLRWQSAGAVATWQMFNDLHAAVQVRNVVMDADVVDLVMRLPSELRAKGVLGVGALRCLHWRSAWLPNSNTLVPAALPKPLHKAASELRPQLGKLKRRFIENSYKTTAAWPHYPLFFLKDEQWRNRLTETLAKRDLFDSQLFDRDEIGRAVDEFLGGDQSRYYDVQRLLQHATIVEQLQT